MRKHNVDKDGFPISPDLRRLEDEVCRLAAEYRGADTEAAEKHAIEAYQSVLRQLIQLGWGAILPIECELPDEYLPQEYRDLVDELNGLGSSIDVS